MRAPERATGSASQPDYLIVVGLDDLDAGKLPVAGGKAANLGELIGAGLPVPPGFCVTAEAYREMAEVADLAEILDRLAVTPPSETAALAGPARVGAAVVDAYRALGDDAPVAVRSSATAEDLPFASFAGQQDTYLNVVGVDAVLASVRRCWASLWTDRAVQYRNAN